MQKSRISPTSRRFKNRRLLQALGFACLAAAAALPARAQTTYTWNGGNFNWEDSTRWTPMMVPNSASADVFIDGGKTGINSIVTMTASETVGRLTIDVGDTLNIANNQILYFQSGAFNGSGSIINNGTINLQSAGSGDDIRFVGANETLSGTGTINMTGANNRIFAQNGNNDRLTISAGSTIAGTGNLGAGNSAFTNNGLVNANINGQTLTIQPGGGGDFTNGATGIAQASNGGTLALTGNNFVNGKFQALAGSTVSIGSNAIVSGATLATAGTGTVVLADTATLNNVTNTGTINAANNSVTYFGGTLTNNGTINLNSLGNGDDLRFTASGVTLAGTGTVTLNGANNRIFAQNGNNDRLIIGLGQTIAGMGNLGSGVSTFTNNGIVNANQNGQTLTLQPGGSGDFTNGATGVTEATGGGNLALVGNNFVNGTFQAFNNSTVTIGSNAIVTGATLATSGTGAVVLADTATLNNVTNAGIVNAANNSVNYFGGTLTNNGTINLNSAGNGDDLRFTSNGVILAGTGTINLNGPSDRLYAANGNNDRLFINAGATVAGNGNLGAGVSTFTNAGTVNANQSGLTLTLQPGGDFTNLATGVTEATGGGTLALIGGSFVNGTFQALAGSTVSIGSNATVSGSTLATTGSGTVFLTDTATLNNVTNTGTVNAANNSITYFGGTLTNNGTINLNSNGNGDDIRFANGVMLAGTGTINLNGAADRIFARNGNNDRLIIGLGQTIAGNGNLGIGNSTFTNNGTVNANQNGLTLTLQPGGGGDFTNGATGVARASNGGTLALLGNGTFSGAFQALAGSQVTISGGSTLNAATLSTTGTGTVTTLDSATFTNVTNNGTLIGANNSITYLTNTFTNNGTFNLNSLGNGDDIRFANGTVLAGTGTINLNGAVDRIFATSGNNDRLTINAGATVAGNGNLGLGVSTFTNNGTVNANQSGLTLTLQPGGDFTTGATGVTEATGGGLMVQNGSSFTNNGTYAVVSGSAGGNSSLTVTAGRLTNFAGTTLTGGTYNVISTNAAGTSTLSLGGGTITTNAARVTLSGAATVFAEINALAANQGSFAVANGRNFTTAGALANSGTLVAAGGSTLTVNGGLTQSAAGTLTGNGTFTASAFTLAGNVNPGGNVDATTGVFADAAGTTTLNGPTTFMATQFHFELGSTNPGASDRIAVNGTLNLNGTLNVTALPGFGTGLYDLIDHPVTSVVTSGLTLGTLPAGYTYTLLYAPTQVDLLVSPIPEPGAWTCVFGGAALLVLAQRRRRG